MNHHWEFGHKDLDTKADYAMLQMQIPYEYVNKTLYILFRAVNFTVDEDTEFSQCSDVYIEIEFKEKEKSCDYNGEI